MGCGELVDSPQPDQPGLDLPVAVGQQHRRQPGDPKGLDQARLAGREDERWNFDTAGGVTVVAGPAPQAAPQVERVTIRLETTSAADVIGRVRSMDGVRVISVDVEGTQSS